MLSANQFKQNKIRDKLNDSELKIVLFVQQNLSFESYNPILSFLSYFVILIHNKIL